MVQVKSPVCMSWHISSGALLTVVSVCARCAVPYIHTPGAAQEVSLIPVLSAGRTILSNQCLPRIHSWQVLCPDRHQEPCDVASFASLIGWCVWRRCIFARGSLPPIFMTGAVAVVLTCFIFAPLLPTSRAAGSCIDAVADILRGFLEVPIVPARKLCQKTREVLCAR